MEVIQELYGLMGVSTQGKSNRYALLIVVAKSIKRSLEHRKKLYDHPNIHINYIRTVSNQDTNNDKRCGKNTRIVFLD